MGTICVFGDSITFGACDWESGGWVNRFEMYVAKRTDYQTDIYNLGIPGETSEGLLKRFENEAKIRGPDVIIFAIGINDSRTFSITPENFEENIQILIEKAKKFTSQLVFIGLTSVAENVLSDEYTNEEIKKYDEIVKKLAERNGLPYVYLFDLLSEKDLEDGLHPNSKGHEKIFLTVKRFLEDKKII